jgi:formylglycine-generating enzyme required for sulfatase activity
MSFLFISFPLFGADFTNSIGMEFITVKSGSFFMGACLPAAMDEDHEEEFSCPSGEKTDSEAFRHESPQRKVKISKAFQLGKYEVTFGEFNKFIVSAKKKKLLNDEFKRANSQGDKAAVSYVSWDDTQEFINWLNKKEKTSKYRLPTEAEWEYAVRAGTKTKYSWGDDVKPAVEYSWYDKNSYNVDEKYAHQVGKKKANPWGLFDMHGNVGEWVQDWYDPKAYSYSDSLDPTGPTEGRCKVYRGGSWYYGTMNIRSSHRFSGQPYSKNSRLGFRLLRELK